MANPGVGSKFVSVNLNKSYGQPQSSSSGNAGFSASRVRSANHGGAGGMVVLSRNRSSILSGQKSGQRLSVPPPLNLPSLRKEHERFDSSSLGSSLGGGNAGSGSGHSSSGMGWTKSVTTVLQEKDGSSENLTHRRSGTGDQRVSSPVDGVKGGSVYMPPSARSATGGQPVAALTRAVPTVERAVVLRGEDFPSLQATLPTSSTLAQKQKDGLIQKQKLKTSEDVSDDKGPMMDSSSRFDMRPQMRSSRLTVSSSFDENGGSAHESGVQRREEESWKQDDYLPGPLPVVRLSHMSDWADDERDTGHSVLDRERVHGFSRADVIREIEFDFPKSGIQRINDLPGGCGLRDTEVGKAWEVPRSDPYARAVTTPSREGREGSKWRVNSREVGVDRNGVGARSFTPTREMNKDNKYCDSLYGDNGRDGFSSTVNGSQDSRYIRRDSDYCSAGKNGNHVEETFSGRAAERNVGARYGDSSNRRRNDAFQSSFVTKTSFSLSNKALPVNDPLLNFGREKCIFSNSGKPYIDDAFGKDFASSPGYDARDPFSGGLAGELKIFKRKKDVQKQENFHDPIRESFEAELERVQKMQEQERQRIAEEQARALELAQKEEEERQRLVREEEERRRRLEEEAREAAWRAEQERLEALRRDEEQRIAREEEKKRILLEEDRRKEAAKQKLLELEAKIARRQAGGTKDDNFATFRGDERMTGPVRERDIPRVADVGEWEDSERMVERITSSASSDSSSFDRSFDTGSRPHSSRDASSSYMDRGKHANSWRRDVFDNGNGSAFLMPDQENGYHSPRRDAFGGGKVFPRKEYYGGPGVMPARTSAKGGISEPHMLDDFPHLRGQRWNLSGESDQYNRNLEMDAEFPKNPIDKFGDIGWDQGRSHGSPHAPYAERLFQNSEADCFSSFGRSRHSMRQPRVLPPPSMASMHRSSFRTDNECTSGSAFLDADASYKHGARRNEHIMEAHYEHSYQEKPLKPGIMSAAQEVSISHEQTADKNTPRCDSQSSLSVSSPPNSPTHLSHDDLDESGDSPVPPAADDSEQIDLSDNERVASTLETEKTKIIIASSSVSHGEDEEWAVENSEELQEQEEYDEEEEGYQEEDELHGGDDENLGLSQELEGLDTEEENVTSKVGHMVLGFDNGVEVGMPSSDDLERTSKNGEEAIRVPSLSVDPEASDMAASNADSFNKDATSSEGALDSNIVKALQDMILQPIDTQQISVASGSLVQESVEASGGSAVPSHPPVASAVNSSLSSQSVQPIFSTVSSVPSQAEVPPVQLQFGLFSGPSLISSPVPAIQIGSIQMPLHLHPQVGPSLSQIHPSHPPFFQFGQLRYTSPISQGILPLAPQTMSVVQPNVSAHYSLNQKPAASVHDQSSQDSSTQSPSPNDKISSVATVDQPGLVPKLSDLTQDNVGKYINVLPGTDTARSEAQPSQSQAESFLFVENKTRLESAFEDADQGHKNVKRNRRSLANNNGDSLGQLHTGSQVLAIERGFVGSKAPGTASGVKGKRFVYTVKNPGTRSSFPEASRAESGDFQRRPRRIWRTEFRVRENVDKRQSDGGVPSNYRRQDEKSNLNERVTMISVKGGGKKDATSYRSTKPVVESESLLSSCVVDMETKVDKSLGKESPSKRPISAGDISHSGDGNLKSKGSSLEDVDAPLQSGVVRVFKQPGIETPSDEDDFIEVRSKRQMLNDRREQREKEIKAKSRAVKAPRRPRSISHTVVASSNPNRVASSMGGEMVHSVGNESVAADVRGSTNDEVSTGFATSMASPPLAPIGTPAANVDGQADIRSLSMKSLQTSSVPGISGGGINLVPGLPFDTKSAVIDNVSTSLGPWSNVLISQQMMPLTQTQLDEAMKPARFESHVAPICDHSSAVLEPGKPSTSILSQDKSFSSSTSPLNSLLAGEKIQFGAVTSPTVLPLSSRAISNGIGPPGLCRPDIPDDHNLSASGSDSTLFFDKEKHLDESCSHLEDPEAEAEAAASAVAVAAISSDEVVGNRLGACSVSVSDAKSFRGANVSGLSTGLAGNGQLSGQSRSEESLSVALPADLSVETSSLNLWQPIQSPQHSSSAMLSHFSGASPSHFPCYEMNPMLGGPIFAFGPHDDSVNNQSQPQKSSTPSSGPLGAWQQCHSGVDSFYGPPTGFTGPFITPSGGIPGMQGPHHMIVYNHFAPVGQFGQVGLGFMGTTYIPSGKQPDWKHTPVSSSAGVNEGDMRNLNMVSGQHSPQTMPAPIQHLAPGSPLIPISSPLAMFDTSPFQSSADISLQACWSHVPATLHSVPLQMPPMQQVEGLPSQFGHGLSMESSTGKRFQEAQSPVTADSSRNFPVSTESNTQFPEELGLVDSSNAGTSHVPPGGLSSYSSANGNGKAQNIARSSSRSSTANPNERGQVGNTATVSSSNCSGQNLSSVFKPQAAQQQNPSSQHYLHPIGYMDQRGGSVSQKISSGSEWQHRRVGFQGRNQTSGADKSFVASKMKRIYVAKPSTSGT